MRLLGGQIRRRPVRDQAELTAAVESLGPSHRAAYRQRISTLLATLGGGAGPAHDLAQDLAQDLAAVTAILTRGVPSEAWLTLAVLTGKLPDSAAVQRVTRSARADGPWTALAEVLFPAARVADGAADHWPTVEVVTDRVLVDLTHTAAVSFATGIQRVARETARRWGKHDPVYVGWSGEHPALRRLQPAERRRALHGGELNGGALNGGELPARDAGDPGDAVAVPWRCDYLLIELQMEHDRVGELLALARFSGNRTAAIGFDCVPLTTAETTQADSVGNGFGGHLAAMAHVDRLATISRASAVEYRGWRSMLAGAGLPGPRIDVVPLPAQRSVPSPDALDRARDAFVLTGLPMILVVGSHEPRKNHLAVLHAAELLWRDGLRFSLLFLGGNAWRSEDFCGQVRQLQAARRPVQMFSAVPDDELWAAYQLAHCTVFPSLNEGFGLPVAESLASGTPVITSWFGSMREIADAGGGALLVDPRDDHDIAAAIRRMLRDEQFHARLTRQARERSERTWDEYADELWAYFLDRGDGSAP